MTTPGASAAPKPRRGVLRVYLGAAPGVGKTFAMLSEGHRRKARGTDVVIGYVEMHPRPKTLAAVAGFEVIPRKRVEHRGTFHEEMDIDAVLSRKPALALVDELAHTNAAGSRNAKRWQDVEELLAAGIDVVTTVNIQHIESLNDVIAAVTGTKQRETVPDSVVRAADQIELVDMSPEALRRRLAHGNVYPAEKVDAALANYFRVGNLTALRELALLWLVDQVDEGLQRYRNAHKVADTWPTRERIVVAISGEPSSEVLIRRGARIAARTSTAEFLVVFVQAADGVRRASPVALEKYRQLTQSLSGTFHEVMDEDIANAILTFARGVNATQIVIGARRSAPFWSMWAMGVGDEVVHRSGVIDVHIVSDPSSTKRVRRTVSRPSRVQPLSPTRVRAGWLLALLLPLALTAALTSTRAQHVFVIEVLLYLAAVIAVAVVGGRWPSLAAALLASLLLNYYFAPPIHQFTITEPSNIAALSIFLAVAFVVASIVDSAARQRRHAIESQARADILTFLARQVLHSDLTLTQLAEQIVESLPVDGCTIEERLDDGSWAVAARAGDQPGDDGPPSVVDVGDRFRLRLSAPVTAARDRQVLEAYAAHMAAIRERHKLTEEAAQARAEIAGNQMRVALLAAVSHDLRTPIASIKAAASTLRRPGLQEVTSDERDALLEDIDESADRLAGMIGNLLDLSRLQTGTLRPVMRAESAEALVLAALRSMPPTDQVIVDVEEDLPLVHTDPGLIERVIANVVDNAVKYAGPAPVAVRASTAGNRIEIRVTDSGPGVPDSQKAQMFEAFQRLGDAPKGSGVGLGLAVAAGLCRAVQGEIAAEDTPGGGLTMSISLPIAIREEVGNVQDSHRRG